MNNVTTMFWIFGQYRMKMIKFNAISRVDFHLFVTCEATSILWYKIFKWLEWLLVVYNILKVPFKLFISPSGRFKFTYGLLIMMWKKKVFYMLQNETLIDIWSTLVFFCLTWESYHLFESTTTRDSLILFLWWRVLGISSRGLYLYLWLCQSYGLGSSQYSLG